MLNTRTGDRFRKRNLKAQCRRTSLSRGRYDCQEQHLSLPRSPFRRRVMEGEREMRKEIAIFGAALLVLAGPAVAGPDQGGRSEHSGPAAEKMAPPSAERHHSERPKFDGDRRRGEADVHVRDHRDGSHRRGRHDRDFVVRHGHPHVWGGVTFYLSDGYYYGECDWLKRRAIRTDSSIWWSRYHRCRDFS